MLLLASSPQVSFTESPGASTLSSWSWQPPPSVSRSCSLTYVNQGGRWCGVNTKYLPAVCFLAGGATTSQVQIWNNTSRELSFDLSWPAHCLTITPQHGVIDPQSVQNPLTSVLHKVNIGRSFFFKKKIHEFLCVQRCNLQILVSPNPSLASKSALLPWSGQVYVQCDGQQKVHTHTHARWTATYTSGCECFASGM